MDEKLTSFTKEVDKWDIPIPKISFKWKDNELKMVKHMNATIEKCIKTSGGEILNIDQLIKVPCINKISITKHPIPEPNNNRLAADLIVPCAMKSSKPIKNTPPAISSLKTAPTLIASSPTSGNMSLVIASENK